MITLIEALNYRSLKYVRQGLRNFQVLVGPNASGKTTFLDVVSFFSDLINLGPEAAVRQRTQTLEELFWKRAGDQFQLAIEAEPPSKLLDTLSGAGFKRVRYEVAIGTDKHGAISILRETVLLLKDPQEVEAPRVLFPDYMEPPASIISNISKQNNRVVVNKKPDGNDNFYSEVYKIGGKGWAPAFRLGPQKSALANLPEDEIKFPVATWLKGFLGDGVKQLVLNSHLLRKPSPPGQSRGFQTDGKNLPWVIDQLKMKAPDNFGRWIKHVQTALGDIESIDTVQREEDKFRYLIVNYRGGIRVPSWLVSDGTLRLLALTVPAYLPDFQGVYLIEEPENGIHPRAAETVFSSLSSVYDAQILMASHSPVILGCADPEDVLCFAKSNVGATDIVRGDLHPALAEWRHETTLGQLFASGILG